MWFTGIWLIVLPLVSGHSWMSCPPSFIATPGRGGVQNRHCETGVANAIVTTVHAGDRLKVGWTSNNHGGGYVRISLVPLAQEANAEAFKQNVMKFACYGHDTRPDKTLNGDCVHPCDGRPGCEFQSDQYDVERFDTTIGIPTNLPEGYYVLQTAMLVGNGGEPYFSCAKLYITGGNPSFNCVSNRNPITYSCLRTGGPALETHFLKVGSSRGDFCYHLDGRIGTVDDNLRDVPINVECDPRLTCDNSINKDICNEEAPSMKDIIGGATAPRLPGCRVFNTVPSAAPTCFDDKQNRDEEGVDCGGTFCNQCPTRPPRAGAFQSDIVQTVNVFGGGGGGSFTITVNIIRTIPDDKCWQLVLQYAHPLELARGSEYAVYNDGQLADINTAKTIITLEKRTGRENPKEGGRIIVAFQASNPGLPEVKWTVKNIEPVSAMLFVKDEGTCVEDVLVL
ncbi:uncharacterized protein LOC130636415 [Hydractinia symbiolongicarpus]|uniref:uncharacterized protein LOC130636415 n=1 Tax=Hydractinia symbiolongicarpus TaxID=13093 RepID=UPI00254C62A0|nr:uncharacterized protein LOC130636415 [Hydractinia symbiolongicarpus]